MAHGLIDAEAALDLVFGDPIAAARAARDVVTGAVDVETRTVALRALGLALAETDELAAAAGTLRRAITLARRHRLAAREAQARLSLAGVLVRRGDTTGALRQLDAAVPVASGVDAARVAAQRGLVLSRTGRYDAALAAYRSALPVLRRAGDHRFVALVLLNRGALRAWRGDTTAGVGDLEACLALAAAHGYPLLAADAAHNLGYAAARAGDVPGALAAFDRAERMPGITAGQRAITHLDRAQTLLEARLATDAATEARRAIALLEPLGHGLDVGIAWLLLAEAALLVGESDTARTAAQRAGVDLRAQRDGPWPAAAGHTQLAARVAAGERGPAVLRTARASVARLDRAGWREPAAQARILCADLLREAGHRAAAAEMLGPAALARRGGPAGLRAAAWHAEALRRADNGDRTGALSAALAGVRMVETHLDSLGAADLRAHAAGHGVALADLGLQLTLECGTPAAAMVWADRLRARSLWRPPVHPPVDPVLAGLLTQLRAATEDGDDPERVRLERAVQARARHAPGVAGGVPRDWPRVLPDALGDKALVYYLRHREHLLAIGLIGGRHRVHELGPWAPIAAELDWLRFAAHRLHRAESAAAATGLRHSAEVLDAALLRPIKDLTDRPLVLVPTAELHAVPWSVLDSARGRPVEVAPSAGHWWAATRIPRRRRGRVLLASGPGLPHAEHEITALTALRPEADVLRGPAATNAAVLAGLSGARLAHLACHGHYRADNPQFSALALADGPLTVYDLAALPRAPGVLVLSACEAARCATAPGEELLGLAAAILTAGTRTLIAPVLAVPDEATAALMIELHRRLLAGEAPAAALAAASADVNVPGFVCLGAG
jgi:tetratricopeptide (TPR) repeat protein